MADYKKLCAELAQHLDDALDFTVSGETRRYMKELVGRTRAALAEPEPEGPTMFKPDGVHPFVVRHYTDDERPSIKGNGFDGLEVGEDRQEAEEFIAWINARLFPSRSN